MTPTFVAKLPKNIRQHTTNKITNFNLYISNGAIEHARERHPEDFEKYFDRLAEVVSNPDFTGFSVKNPSKLEIVKRLEENVLIGINIR